MASDNPYPADAPAYPAILRWGHAQCHILTLALHERTGWAIITLHDGRIRIGNSVLDDCGLLLHSGVVDPSGFLVDIRGRHASREFFVVGDGPRLPVNIIEVEPLYLADPSDARWSCDLQPEPCDLIAVMDRHDLIPDAIEDAHAIINERLVGKVPGIGPDRLFRVEGGGDSPAAHFILR